MSHLANVSMSELVHLLERTYTPDEFQLGLRLAPFAAGVDAPALTALAGQVEHLSRGVSTAYFAELIAVAERRGMLEMILLVGREGRPFRRQDFDTVLRALRSARKGDVLASGEELQRASHPSPEKSSFTILRNREVLLREAQMFSHSLEALEGQILERIHSVFTTQDFVGGADGHAGRRAAERVLARGGVSAEAALGALLMLLNPVQYSWLAAAYNLLPAWFEGPDDPSFMRHYERRLRLTLERGGPRPTACVDVLGSRGHQLILTLNKFVEDILQDARHRRSPRLTDIQVRILVRDPQSLLNRHAYFQHAQGALFDARIGLTLKQMPPGQLQPFHGNAMGFILDEGQDSSSSFKRHYEHLYLGLMEVAPDVAEDLPLTFAGPYMYLDRPPNSELAQVAYIKGCFDCFASWMDYHWRTSTTVFEIGATGP